MPDVIKTIEGWREAKRVLEFLSEPPPSPKGRFLFNVGRAAPKQPVTRLWFVFRGRILGSFAAAVEENHGDLGREYAHQFEPPYFKAARFLFVCQPPFRFLSDEQPPVYHEGFRGWRYFDFEPYSKSMDAKVRI